MARLYIIAILSLLFLQGCAFFADSFVIGSGSRKKEFYQDGTLKSIEVVSKSPISDVVNMQVVKTD